MMKEKEKPEEIKGGDQANSGDGKVSRSTD